MHTSYKVGDWVIYRVSKTSPRPGPRAQHVHPLPNGEAYSYTVDKYWIVAEIEDNGELLLRTRTGKEHHVSPTDRCLRKANLWERWARSTRFPADDGPDEARRSHPIG
jgi:hypothetical protein